MSNTELADLLKLTDWRRDAMLQVQRDQFRASRRAALSRVLGWHSSTRSRHKRRS